MRDIGCVVLFLLPFAGFGLFAAVQAVRTASAGDVGQAGLLAIFALVFGGVGIGGIAGVLAGRRKLAEADALRANHPESPWLWRTDWAAGRIEDSGRTARWGAWIFAGLWNLISIPSAWLAVRSAMEKGNKAALIALLFPLVGLGLLVAAVRATLRYRRYGVSVLELKTTPVALGHGLIGAVRTTSDLTARDGFRLVLNCIRRVTRGTGKRRSTSETILWQEERRVPGRLGRTEHGMATTIPVAFGLPADGSPCDDRDRNDRVLWRLEVSADVPGVDYHSSFDVPVFRTAGSATPRTAEEERELLDPSGSAEYRQSPASRIQVATNRRGTEINFPAARNPGAAFGVTVFLALWVGCIALMIYLGAPLAFPIVFGLVALLLVWGALELWLRVTRITVEGGTVTVGSGYLTPSRERRFSADEITEVAASTGMQAGGRLYYDLTLVPSTGKRVIAGHGIQDKREAEYLVEVVNGALGAGRGGGQNGKAAIA